MWPKFYRDYKVDKPLVKYQVRPGHGIVGCEMHDLNGWGNTLHIHTTGKLKPRIRSRIPLADEEQVEG